MFQPIGFPFQKRTKKGTDNSQKLVLSVWFQDRLKHSPIGISPDGKYVISDASFNTLTEVVARHKEEPIVLKCRSGEKSKVVLSEMIPNDNIYMIKPWYIPNLKETTVNR